MRTIIIAFSFLIVCLSAPLLMGADLVIKGIDSADKTLTKEAILSLPQITVKAVDHKVETEFTGVPLHELLKLVDAPLGEKLRGTNMDTYLLVNARDGYRAVFALTELDPSFTDQVAILAHAEKGKSMDDVKGPYRLVLPHEKRQSRWVRQVESFEILIAPGKRFERKKE